MSCTMTTPPHTAFSQGSSRVQVHFDDHCVLIPDPVVQSRMPRLVKKSYSLPLWRRRSNSTLSSDPDGVLLASSGEEKGVVITVPVPSFSKSRSPTRGEHQHQPLVPCLVGASQPTRHYRSPSLPLPPRPDIVTIPLRACCAECYTITEESLKEGEQWQEKFTRGARRRRNSSADTHAHLHAQRHRMVRDDLPGFGAVVSVDEIDKRHGISRTASTSQTQSSEEEDGNECLLPSLTRRLQVTEQPSVHAITEEIDEGFPLPRRASMDLSSASSSPLAQTGIGNTPCIILQGNKDCDRPIHPLPFNVDPVDEELGPTRATIYYTPESSPILPSLEPSSALTASPPENYLSPPTPPITFVLPPSTGSVPIPGSEHQKSYFSNLSLSSFELVHTLASPSSPLPLPSAPDDGHSISTASPELTDFVPALSSSGPTRKRLLNFPNLPGPGSFLRVGAEMFKGLATPGVSPVA